MSLEALYFVSQIVAAVAIIASLAFVAVQLRQNTQTQRVQLELIATQRAMQTNEFFYSSENAMLLAKLASGDKQLPQDEVMRAIGMTRNTLLNFELIDAHRKAGLIDEPTFEAALYGTQRYFAMPGTRICWEMIRRGFPNRTVEMVDSVLTKNVPMQNARDFAGVWKHAADKVLGSQVQ
jgi:hypothetical protein